MENKIKKIALIINGIIAAAGAWYVIQTVVMYSVKLF